MIEKLAQYEEKIEKINAREKQGLMQAKKLEINKQLAHLREHAEANKLINFHPSKQIDHHEKYVDSEIEKIIKYFSKDDLKKQQ